MYDANGYPEYLVCVTLDITDRKLAEAALLDSENRLRATITHSPNPMIMHAEDGTIIMMSAALSETLATDWKTSQPPKLGQKRPLALTRKECCGRLERSTT
jgi:hypothetical protein